MNSTRWAFRPCISKSTMKSTLTSNGLWDLLIPALTSTSTCRITLKSTDLDQKETPVDPCFGEIVQGRKTIEMIYSLHADRDFVLENPVHIVKARIMDIETDHRGAAFAPHDMKDKHFVAGR